MSSDCDNPEEQLFNQSGNILISDQFNNRVIEVTPRGEIVWSFGLGPTNFTPNSIIGVNDAERVGDLTLMVGTGIKSGVIPEAPTGVIDNRVILVNKNGKIIWQYGQFGQTGIGYNLLTTPVQATFISCHKSTKNILNGTVLITDQGNNRIIQVDDQKEIVWQYPGRNINPSDQLNSPSSAEKLKDGNILIADNGNKRAIEINKRNIVVRVFTASGTLKSCSFASRLPNGNTLLTDSINNRIIEVNIDDMIVWQYLTNSELQSIHSPMPTRGLRLRNGNTLISDQFNNRVIRINSTVSILAYYGLPLKSGSGTIGPNNGYNLMTTQLGLYSPSDAKIIGDYTGITPP